MSTPLHFGEYSARAIYDPSALYIKLNQLCEDKIRAANSTEAQAYKSILPLLHHELAHFIDHTSTNWGIRNLVQLANAAQARTSQNEFHYKQVLDWYRHIKSIKFSRYYTEIADPGVHRNIVWGYQFSCGTQFSNSGLPDELNPVVFTRFFEPIPEHEGIHRRPLVRVPFSVGSLLEVNAVASSNAIYEAGLQAQVAFAGNAFVDKEFCKAELTEELACRLFDTNRAIYSIAAHCVANLATTTSSPDQYSRVTEAYRRASAISQLSLSLTPDLIRRIRIPESHSIWKNRAKRMRQIGDRGYVFLCLVANLGDVGTMTDEALQDAVLDSSGLPDRDACLQLILADNNKLLETIPTGIFGDYIQTIVKEGIERLKSIGLLYLDSLLDQGQNFNVSIFDSQDNALEYNHANWRLYPSVKDSEHDSRCFCRDKMLEFVEACIP
jgi:hypothetical protein